MYNIGVAERIRIRRMITLKADEAKMVESACEKKYGVKTTDIEYIKLLLLEKCKEIASGVGK